MRKRAFSGTAGTEPIPGYILRKRLGSGGYGEVWLADAPGGLRKAVKLIYGQVDEMRATSELRSLERVRRASHPFLLSIERIEVVQGKVIIVTELAESSLQDRFENFRRQGLPGIPRSQLLEFLRDAADALDFLGQKHSLQHLDVKPGNLLIIADRIKVADFGLVKDLHDSNQSLVGGLTPTYSAPELFDGRPTFRSDQYSLALVYMEMLTGQLPFRGSTAGELARQHLSMAPDLDPLPPADRNAVLRALSKNPLDRYSSCKQFIEQLMKVRGSVVLCYGEESPSTGASAVSTACSSSSEAMTQSSLGRQHLVHPAIPLQDLASQWVQTRCLFIGLGGQGVQALQELRCDLDANVDDRFGTDDHQWLAVDTDFEVWEHSMGMGRGEHLPNDSLFHLPIHSPHHYRRYPVERFASLSRRWLYNIPRTLKTEGVRPIATLSLLENYPDLRIIIEQKLKHLVQQHNLERQGDSPLKIYCMASLHGGTGSALLAEVGMLVRSVMQQLNFADYRLCGAVSAATVVQQQAAPSLHVANAIAALSELSHWMDPSRMRSSIANSHGMVSNNTCPFDWISLVDGGALHDSEAHLVAAKNLARHVSLDCQSLVSAALSQSRTNAKLDSEHGWLRNFLSTSIQDLRDHSPETLAQWCSLHALWSVLTYLSGTSNIANLSGDFSISRRSTSISQLPLTDEACEEFTQRLLREMGIIAAENQQGSSTAWKEKWKSRLSDAPDFRDRQLGLDLSVWQRVMEQLISRRAYTWPYVEQIQAKVVETLQQFGSDQSSGPIQSLLAEPDGSTPSIPISHQIADYLSILSDACQQAFAATQKEWETLNQRYRHWWSTLSNDSQLNKLMAIDLLGLPESIRQLARTTKNLLEKQLCHSLVETLNSAVSQFMTVNHSSLGRTEMGEAQQEVLHNYSKMLLFSHESITTQIHELELSPEIFSCGDYHYQSIAMADLPNLQPALFTGGGEVYRIVLAPEQQMSQVGEAIEAMGLRTQTTLLPCTVSQGIQAVCDAVHLNVPYLISTLWRPTGATLDLAERLRTRIDIDWDPVSCLLEGHRTQPSRMQENASSDQQSQPNPVLPSQVANNCLDSATFQI